jgi:trehalose 6-phosphate phosphatase
MATLLDAPPPLSATDALFLDLDGTLAPIAPRPELAAIPARTLAALDRLASLLDGRIAVVSGRHLGEIRQLTDRRIPVLAGVHGLERQVGGTTTRAAPAPGIAPAAAALTDYAAARPGVLLEDKQLSVALHYRLAPGCADEALALAFALAAEHGLSVQTGKMVVELRTPGADKGAALAAIMADPPFAGSRPWFVGDDDTDEAGFAAAAEHGGAGILVGDPRPSAARYRLSGTEALTGWLEDALARCPA